MPIGLKNVEELKVFARNVHTPAVYAHSDPLGVKVTPQELERMGTWKIVIYDTATTAATSHAIMKMYANVKEKGATGLDVEEMTRVMQRVEELIGLPKFYEMEEKTTGLWLKERQKKS